MSAVRSDSPTLPPPTRALAPTGDARAAFFQAALQKVQAAGPQAAPPPAVAVQAAQADPEPSPRFARPGSLLDIRV